MLTWIDDVDPAAQDGRGARRAFETSAMCRAIDSAGQTTYDCDAPSSQFGSQALGNLARIGRAGTRPNEGDTERIKQTAPACDPEDGRRVGDRRQTARIVPTPAPQGFLGHLIAREYSQEACRDGETRSGIGGGGGRARRATGDAAGRGRGGRLSARRKRETVLRLLRGEDLESVSRELGITAARASQWRDRFLAAGQASLKSRAPDARDEANRRLQAKIGELLMETELLYAKVDQLEAGGPLARRRSRR